MAEVVEIDSGYDVSTYATRTTRPFDLAEFETVKDFFGEPTGETCATYVTGNGFRAETIEDAFLEEVRCALERDRLLQTLRALAGSIGKCGSADVAIHVRSVE